MDKDYSRLKCSGTIPHYFKQLLAEDIQKDKSELLNNGTKLNKKNASEFVAITNYGIKKYIRSGKVLYGDPLTLYATKILDKLKAVSDQNVDHVKVFTLKSTEVNAFAVHQGFIFITTGLWAHLENETQLAHILGHELQHIISRHSLEKFEFISDQISFGQIGKEELSDQFKYSREAEFEADEAGFLLAQKAGYNDSLLISSMNVLAMSHRPIEEYKIDYSRFEDSYFKLPKVVKLLKMEEVTSQWDFNAKNSTHPNMKSRYEKLLEIADYSDIESLSSNSDFTTCRTIARAEMLNAFIVSGNYLDGLYHNIILLNKYPNNSFLKRSYAMMWYARAAEINTEFGARYSSDFRLTSGELERFYFMFFKMSKAQLSTMAVREIWRLSIENPKDEFLVKLRQKSLLEFVRHPENNLENFKTIEHIERLTKERKKQRIDFSSSIAVLLDNPNFINEVNAAYRQTELRDKNNEIFLYSENIVDSNKSEGKLLLAKPLYSKQDLRKNVKKNVISNESKENQIVKLAKKFTKEDDMNLEFFGNMTDSLFETSNYNQMAILYDYLQENIKHPEYDFLPFNSQNLNQIEGIDSVGSIGFISMQSIAFNKRFSGAGAVFSTMSVFGFPSYLRWQLEPKQYSFLFTQIYDLKTHNPSLRYMKFCDTPLNVYLESAQIYNALNQFNSK